jgi:hypothetical protein
MLLMTLFALLLSVLRSCGAPFAAFAVISTMVAAVAIGQTLLFSGRYPRAASIWVGGCLFPLQLMALWLWRYLAYGGGSWFNDLTGMIVFWTVSLLVSIAVGAGLGYLTGRFVGGLFFILDALGQPHGSQRDAIEAAERAGPTEIVRSPGNHEGDEKRGEVELVASSPSDRPWGARWDKPAAGVPRRFGVGVLMLLITLFAVLFSVMRSIGASVGTFAVISTMVAAVAIGQILLFGGRYPRAASVWVGACFFPLQVIALWLWSCFEDGGRLAFNDLTEQIVVGTFLLLVWIPIGAVFGYLSGAVVGGVFLILDALAHWQQSRRATIEAAEPREPTEVVQGGENYEANQGQRGSSGQGARPG